MVKICDCISVLKRLRSNAKRRNSSGSTTALDMMVLQSFVVQASSLQSGLGGAKVPAMNYVGLDEIIIAARGRFFQPEKPRRSASRRSPLPRERADESAAVCALAG